MNQPKRTILSLNILFLFCSALMSCSPNAANNTGTHNPPPPPPPSTSPYRVPAIPNDRTFAFQKQPQAENHGWSIIRKVYAQSSGAAIMTGNYSGFCANTMQNATNISPAWTTIYGLGSLSQSDPIECGGGASSGTAWYSLPNAMLGPNAEAPPVVGSGTLEGLVVVDSPNSIMTAGDGVILVLDLHNGSWTQTPITCMLGTAPRCEDTTDTFPISDGDRIAVVLSLENNGDSLAGLQVFLGKQ